MSTDAGKQHPVDRIQAVRTNLPDLSVQMAGGNVSKFGDVFHRGHDLGGVVVGKLREKSRDWTPARSGFVCTPAASDRPPGSGWFLRASSQRLALFISERMFVILIW